jgi:hypothetical protein
MSTIGTSIQIAAKKASESVHISPQLMTFARACFLLPDGALLHRERSLLSPTAVASAREWPYLLHFSEVSGQKRPKNR